MATLREPWDARPDEHGRAFEAFTAFILIPRHERTLKKLANDTGVKYRTLCAWSRKFNWQRRAALYDADQIRRRRLEDEHDEAQDRERLKKIARRMGGSVAEAVSVSRGSDIAPKDFPAWARAYADLTARVYPPTQKVAVEVAPTETAQGELLRDAIEFLDEIGQAEAVDALSEWLAMRRNSK